MVLIGENTRSRDYSDCDPEIRSIAIDLRSCAIHFNRLI
jgi:hypothetical protein